MARPSSFTQETADAICGRLIGGESLRQICLSDDMPDKSTVMRWLASENHTAFRDQYARAKTVQADVMAEEILDIADDGTNDYKSRMSADGSTDEVIDHDHIARSRLRVDARKWLMSKMAPKKYGDKLQHTGPDGDEPAKLVIEWQRPNASAGS